MKGEPTEKSHAAQAAPSAGAQRGAKPYALPTQGREDRHTGRPLAIGLLVSLLVHLVVLMLQFATPEQWRIVPNETSMEVVLLNARSREQPITPQVQAQVDMQGGGDDETGRAKSPLPPADHLADGLLKRPDQGAEPTAAATPSQTAPERPSEAAATAERATESGSPQSAPPNVLTSEHEERAPATAEQTMPPATGRVSTERSLDTESVSVVPDPDSVRAADPTGTEAALGRLPQAAASASEAEVLDQEMARLQAQIARQIEDYNRRPRRLTYGINAVGVTFARYVDDWAETIERIGTERFPKDAHGHYDSLIITVEIDKYGNVLTVEINRKSKFDALNRMVRQIVYSGAPYKPFTPEMVRDGDILQIVRTWTFTNDGLESRGTTAKELGR